MAAVFNPAGARARYGLRRRYQPITDINVTPLVDVMLVLLIVFMVTAPLLTVGVEVDLPKVQNQAINTQEEPLVVTVQKDGNIALMQTPIDIAQLVPRLLAITSNKPDTQIYLRGDQAINYGRVMEVMGTLSAAGFTKVALITELPKDAPAATQKPNNP
ncbi:MAG TPA: protein TolR [Candidatus Acidoferrum sp.]|nr:protein TolR [Candidatus Acidoferrum sp.]